MPESVPAIPYGDPTARPRRPTEEHGPLVWPPLESEDESGTWRKGRPGPPLADSGSLSGPTRHWRTPRIGPTT